ncbi:site-specific tyrosine recombinase/integron integrase [Alkaliflexus imshenetskii]|uniref:site-specific tyrosine recombinase/integron integrase n=1 Tax=Alkaliflexus imshenetskii TaxID=286730 RepID=UPI0004B4B917|nr:site-specific tyrosine recombinase/integron integrase [Alkaliflexus imshenetskii]
MNQKPNILLTPELHNGMPVILFKCDYHPEIISLLKSIPGIKWSNTKKAWYQRTEDFNLQKAFSILSPEAFLNYTNIKSKTETLVEKNEKSKRLKVSELPDGYLEKLQQKRYSENTIRNYMAYMRKFIDDFHGRNLESLTQSEINMYILDLINNKHISPAAQNLLINAIKFYYEQVLGRRKQHFELDRPRRERKLPKVLSKQEVSAMIKATNNLKHKSIISLLYSCGLRRSEAINLKPSDIESKRMVVKVRCAKGKKDRYVPLSTGVLDLLREYYKIEIPKNWLFEGLNGSQYSETSILNIVKNAARKAGIKRNVHPHILRHCYATHHLEQGTDLRYIQAWLGHESSKTTEIYTHVSQNNFNKFKNPIDDMDLGLA